MRAICIIILMFSGVWLYAGSSVPDACKILLPQDVQQVLGAGYQPSPFHGTASDNSVCAYTKDARTVAGITVVQVSGMEIGAARKQMQDQFKARGRKITPVADAGDNAFQVEAENPLTHAPVITIHYGKTPWHIVMDVKTNGKSDADAEVKLAKLTYPRLP
jgi:hypothetical protein